MVRSARVLETLSSPYLQYVNGARVLDTTIYTDAPSNGTKGTERRLDRVRGKGMGNLNNPNRNGLCEC